MQQIGKDFDLSANHICDYYRFSTDDENTRVILWGYPDFDLVTGVEGEPRYIGDVVFCIDGSPTVIRGPTPASSVIHRNSLPESDFDKTHSLSYSSSNLTLSGFSYSTKAFHLLHETSQSDSFDIKQILKLDETYYVRTNIGVHILTEERNRDNTVKMTIRYIPIESKYLAFRDKYLYIFQKYSVSKYTLAGDCIETYDKVTPFHKFDEFKKVMLMNTVFIVFTSSGDVCSIDKDMNITSLVGPEVTNWQPFIHGNILYTIGCCSHKLRLFQSTQFIKSESAKLRCLEALTSKSNGQMTIQCTSSSDNVGTCDERGTADVGGIPLDSVGGIPLDSVGGIPLADVNSHDCGDDGRAVNPSRVGRAVDNTIDGCGATVQTLPNARAGDDGCHVCPSETLKSSESSVCICTSESNDVVDDYSEPVGTWLHLNGGKITLQECVDLEKLKMIIDNFKDPYIQTSVAKFKPYHKYNNGDYISKAICGYYGQSSTSEAALRSLYKYLIETSDKNDSCGTSIGRLQVSYRQKGLWILGGPGGYGEYGHGNTLATGAKFTLAGRYFSTSITSLQNMSKPIRQTICGDIYWDVDMVNAFPTILSQYCKIHGIPCPILDHYVANREEIIRSSGLSRDVFKSRFFTVMTQSGIDQKLPFFTSVTQGGTTLKIQFFPCLSAEISTIGLRFLALNPPRTGSSNIHKNLSLDDINRYIMMEVLCSIENEIMWNAFQFLQGQGYHPEVLCFDGLMVRKQGELSTLNRTLVDLSEFIRQKTKYNVEFVVKPMTDALDLSKIAGKIAK